MSCEHHKKCGDCFSPEYVARLERERDEFRDRLHPLARETRAETARRHIEELEIMREEIQYWEKKFYDAKDRAEKAQAEAIALATALAEIESDPEVDAITLRRIARAALKNYIPR